MESLRRPAAPAPETPDTPSPERRRAFVLASSPAARDALLDAARRSPALALVGQARRPERARRRLEASWPDLVLIDGELLGEARPTELGRLLAPWRAGLVVAGRGPEQAAAAFELGASAFLPLPRSPGQLAIELAGLAASVVPGAAVREVTRRLVERRLARRRLDDERPKWLLVRERNRMVPVPVADLLWIRGAGNYATLRWPGGEVPLRSTLADLETRLDPARFVRIHRSWIVPVRRIAGLATRPRGGYLARLEDGTRVVVSERYRERLVAALGGAVPAERPRSRRRSE